MEKRNIVLITFDSLRADHCSFMGYHRKTTPTLDKMARKGLYFENAVASGVATPTSMFGVHTSEYPKAVYEVEKLNDQEWRKEFRGKITIAQTLSTLGYMTGAVHANPAVSRFFGFNKGFVYFEDFIKFDGRKLMFFDKLLDIIGIKCFIENTVTILKRESTAIDWKKLVPYIQRFVQVARKEKKPYFLWVLLLDTHIPYLPPKNELCRLSIPYLVYLNWKIRKNYLNPNKISDEEKEKIINAYDGSIYYADKFLKVLWDLLKDDDPIFIIHADHGEGFGEHGFYYHPAMLYEELLHVPLVIYNADIKQQISYPVSLRSIPTTILELINSRDKSMFKARSLLNTNEYVISKVFNGCKWIATVRTQKWKYIMGQKDMEELYDLVSDPLEQYNLCCKYRNIYLKMKEILKLHFKYEYEKARIRSIGDKLKL